MGLPIDHHFIPRFFLRPWRGDGGRLTCFSIKNGHLCIDRYTPTQVAKQAYLYSLYGVSPEQAQVIETDILRPIDDAAAPIHKLFVDNTAPKLTDKQREDWGRFVLSLRARTPQIITSFREKGRQTIIDKFLRNPEEFDAIKGSLPHASLLELVQERVPALIENFGLANVFPQVLLESEILPHLLALDWHVLDFARNRYRLLLADNPVFIYGHKYDAWMWALPISPTRVFIAINRPLNNLRDPVKEANVSAIRQSRAYIYASGSEALPFIKKHWSPVG